MSKAIAVASLGLALFTFGCAGGDKVTKSENTITKERVVHCPKCGAEFTVGAGLSYEGMKN